MLEPDDRDRLNKRVRQEMTLAEQRPLPPMAPPGGILTPAAIQEPPMVAATPGRKMGLRQFLRDLPLLGSFFAWLNSLRNLAAMRRHIAAIDVTLIGLATHQTTFAARQTDFAARQAELAERQAEFSRELGALQSAHDTHGQQVSQHLAQHDGSLQTHGRLLVALEESLNAERRDLDAQRLDLAAALRHVDEQRSELHLLQRRLSRLLAAQPTPPTATNAAATVPSTAASDALDAYYTAFEDSFRGSRDEIKQRLSVYVETLEASSLRLAGKPVVDLGCGRGEWLELLGEKNYAAYGIDLNAINVARGTACGLDMRQEDAILHLRGLADGSLAAVSAFHLIEHIPFDLLVELVEEANRVLTAGGLLILETPNPENIQVGACTFYNDPTHRHPIPPAVARFLVENRGFAQVEIRRLHPCPEADRVAANSPLAERFNQFFYGPQDYAVIGRKL